MMLILLQMAVFNVPVAAFVSYCYHNNHGNVNMMLNQSCINGEDHLADRFVSTDYNTSQRTPTRFNRKDFPRSHVEMCVVFRYIVQQNLSSIVSARSSSASFGCDFKHWCKGKSTGFHKNVSMENHIGDVYCCNSNNCNTLSVVPQLPPPQICYKNLHHWNRKTQIGAGTFSMCKNPNAWCVRSRLLNASNPATRYDCDNEHRCQYFNMTSGSSLVCRNVSHPRGSIEELCCCSGSTCFRPPSRSAASAYGGASITDDLGLSGRMRGRGGLSVVTVGCIVAFTLLALVGVAVMVALMYQRRSLPDTSSLTLTYSRIEDDDASDSIHML